MATAIVIGAIVVGPTAKAQTLTARTSGLVAGETLGVSDPQCFAAVFARHAIVVLNLQRQRQWFTPNTPAFVDELQRRCGIDSIEVLKAAAERAREAARIAQAQGGQVAAATQANAPPTQLERQAITELWRPPAGLADQSALAGPGTRIRSAGPVETRPPARAGQQGRAATYNAGLDAGRRVGLPAHLLDCYAQWFARHADRSSGAARQELWSSCGISA